MPKISVIMPIYNGEKYVREAIDSILNQTFTDFEFIIINDRSTDNTDEIINSYGDSRIRYYQNEKNLGIAETLNRGLDFAEGEYMARMDADDISQKDRFEKQFNYMNANTNVVVLGTGFETFGENIENRIFIFPSRSADVKINLLFYTAVLHPSVFMRKKIIDMENFRYNKYYNNLEDYELWFRIIKNTK